MVLLHTPSLTGILNSIRDGHYEEKGPNEIIWDGVLLNAFITVLSPLYVPTMYC